MRLALPALALLASGVALGQLRPAQTRPDLDDLYARVSESAYVVRGKMIDGKGVGRRAPKDLNEMSGKLEGPIRITIEPGGLLFVVAVQQTICRQSDFVAGQSSQSVPLDSLVHVFVPRGESPLQSRFDPRRHFLSEFLEQGREYLLFLRKAPRQEALVSTYQLDPNLMYYRTYEGDRGAVALPDAAHPERPYSFVTPLVSAVTGFCEAVKAPDVETKIRNLDAVRDHSTDPAWRQSVDAAIGALQKAQAQPPQPR